MARDVGVALRVDGQCPCYVAAAAQIDEVGGRGSVGVEAGGERLVARPGIGLLVTVPRTKTLPAASWPIPCTVAFATRNVENGDGGAAANGPVMRSNAMATNATRAELLCRSASGGGGKRLNRIVIDLHLSG